MLWQFLLWKTHEEKHMRIKWSTINFVWNTVLKQTQLCCVYMLCAAPSWQMVVENGWQKIPQRPQVEPFLSNDARFLLVDLSSLRSSTWDIGRSFQALYLHHLINAYQCWGTIDSSGLVGFQKVPPHIQTVLVCGSLSWASGVQGGAHWQYSHAWSLQ